MWLRFAALHNGNLAEKSERRASVEVTPAHTAVATQITTDDKLANTMFEQIGGGRDEEASAMVFGLHLHDHPAALIADRVLCPALRRVGDLWRTGELWPRGTCGDACSALALQALRVSLDGSDARNHLALCCSVEDDFHEVPIRVASLVLAERGWQVFSLGTSTSFFALAEAIACFRPALVCVSSTIFNHPDRAGREYAEFAAAVERTGASTVFGGAGFTAEGMRRRFPADLHADTVSQLESQAAGAGQVNYRVD